MVYFVALLLFVISYAIIKLLLEKVPAVHPIADVAALVGGALIALFYAGALR